MRGRRCSHGRSSRQAFREILREGIRARRSLLTPAHPLMPHPQPKQFRKMIQQTFQQYASLREEECVMKFFNTLAGFANIDQETYRCELIVMTQP